MTTKLRVYNGALRILGERRLSSLTDDVPSRHYLDNAWDDGLVDYILEQGLWQFATRTVKLNASNSIEPDFGFRYAFEKPSDYVRLSKISVDEFQTVRLDRYETEREYFFSDVDVLYISYISNDASYGNDLTLWPETFSRYAQAELADRVKDLVTGSDDKYQKVKAALKEARIDARSKDAMNQPVRFQQIGNWAGARLSSYRSRDRYRGN